MLNKSSPALKSIYDLNYTEIVDIVKEIGQPKFRADQIWQGIYKHYWSEPDQFVGLPTAMRKLLRDRIQFSSLAIAKELHSNDHQTVKSLFTLSDARHIESVLMGYEHRDTLCISTQSGCAMGCTFCATGQMGFFRNLTSGEIIEQVIHFARELHKIDKSVTNIVFMGMGEPFHNYDNVMESIDRLNNPTGWNFGARRMTISTVGIIPGIQRFASEKRQVNLAVSLHSVDNDLRSSMMPVNKKYPVKELLLACRDYVSQTHRRITFEWALIQNVNDMPSVARDLATAIKGTLCHVNLIPLNPTQKFDKPGSIHERALAFQDELVKIGIPCTLRLRRGIDIQAGCGQLASEEKSLTQ